MEDKRILTIARILGVILFLIGVALNPLLNLISVDLANWYSDNRTLALILTGTLIIAGVILTFASVWLSHKQEEDMIREDEGNGTTQVTAEDVLIVVYEAYTESPGDKVNSETVRQKLGLSEQELVDLIAKLEGRGFVKAKWAGRKALLTITEDGILIGKSLIEQ